MSKWVSARYIALRKGESIEIDDEERVVTVEYRPPIFDLIVVKESYRNPNYDE